MKKVLPIVALVVAGFTFVGDTPLNWTKELLVALCLAPAIEAAAVRLPYYGTVSFGLLVYLPLICSPEFGPKSALIAALLGLIIREALHFSTWERLLDEVALDFLPLSLAALIPALAPLEKRGDFLAWLAVGIAFISTRHIGVQLAASGLEEEQRKTISRLQKNTGDIRWAVLASALVAVALWKANPWLLIVLLPLLFSLRQAAIHAYAWLDGADKQRLRKVAGKLSRGLLKAETRISSLSSTLESTSNERDLLLSFSQDTADCRSLSELVMLVEKRCRALELGSGTTVALRRPDGWLRAEMMKGSRVNLKTVRLEDLDSGFQRCWRNDKLCFSQKTNRVYHPLPGLGVLSYLRTATAKKDVKREVAELFAAQVALASLSALRFEQLQQALKQISEWNEALKERNQSLLNLTEELNRLSAASTLAQATEQLEPIVELLVSPRKVLGLRLSSKDEVLYERAPAKAEGQQFKLDLGHDRKLLFIISKGDEKPDQTLAVGLQCAGEILQQLFLQDSLRKAMTQLKESEAQLIESAKLSAVGQLSAGLAHEINNPLGSIRLAIEMTLRKEQLSDLNQNLLNQALNGVERAQNITGSLLSYSRAKDKGQQNLDAWKLVSDSCALLESALQVRGIKLKVPEAGTPANIKVNAQDVQQVITNLLLNAADACESEDSPLVSVAAEVSDKFIIRVQDNGPGVPSDIVGKIFDPFFTTKEVGKGTGLGLSVSRTLAQSQGGKLTHNGGSIFEFSLPLA